MNDATSALGVPVWLVITYAINFLLIRSRDPLALTRSLTLAYPLLVQPQVDNRSPIRT